MRRNYTRRRYDHPRIENFDREYREWPDMPDIATVYAVPLKTKFINSAAAQTANIDKVIFDLEELRDFLPEYFYY